MGILEQLEFDGENTVKFDGAAIASLDELKDLLVSEYGEFQVDQVIEGDSLCFTLSITDSGNSFTLPCPTGKVLEVMEAFYELL